MITENPFAVPREAKSKTFTVRMTPTEHAVIKEIADAEQVEVSDLVREGLGLVVDKRMARPKGKR